MVQLVVVVACTSQEIASLIVMQEVTCIYDVSLS